MANDIRNICLLGAGYVGGPTGAVIAYHNPCIKVTIVDNDEEKIRKWNSVNLPIFEPGLEDIVRVTRDGNANKLCIDEDSDCSSILSEVSADYQMNNGSTMLRVQSQPRPYREPNLFFSTEISKCIAAADLIVITVNTPTKPQGLGAGYATDMTAFEAATVEVAKYASPGALIVEKSTVPCGTSNMIRETLSSHRPGVPFEILSNPEFLAAGTAVPDLLYPDRILIGCANKTASGKQAAEALASIYAPWVPRSRIVTIDMWSAELSKLVANAMLAQRISSVNSITAICDILGADINDIVASIGMDPRIGSQFLKSGIGFGGSCLKKDLLSLIYLAESLGLNEVGQYWRQVVNLNEYQLQRFARRVIQCFNGTLIGKKLVLFGYAFKANTSNTRESPALEIIRCLLEENPLEIAIYEPNCDSTVICDKISQSFGGHEFLRDNGGPLQVYRDPYEACASAIGILITTDSDIFRVTPDLSSESGLGALAKSKPQNLAEGSSFVMNHSHEQNNEILQDGEVCASNPESSFSSTQSHTDQSQVTGAGAGTGLESMENSGSRNGKLPREQVMLEQVDWHRISSIMGNPKWIFDGRGIVAPERLTELGFRVETLGRPSAS